MVNKNRSIDIVFKIFKSNLKKLLFVSFLLSACFGILLMTNVHSRYRGQIILEVYSEEDSSQTQIEKLNAKRALAKTYVDKINLDSNYVEIEAKVGHDVRENFLVFVDDKSAMINIVINTPNQNDTINYAEFFLQTSAVKKMIDSKELKLLVSPSIENIVEMRPPIIKSVSSFYILCVILGNLIFIILNIFNNKVISPFQFDDLISIMPLVLVKDSMDSSEQISKMTTNVFIKNKRDIRSVTKINFTLFNDLDASIVLEIKNNIENYGYKVLMIESNQYESEVEVNNKDSYDFILIKNKITIESINENLMNNGLDFNVLVVRQNSISEEVLVEYNNIFKNSCGRTLYILNDYEKNIDLY